MTDIALRRMFSRVGVGDRAQSNRIALAVSLTTVMVLGFILRYLLIVPGAVVNGDGIFYIWRAKTLMTGDLWNGVSAYWSPLYSLLIGLFALPVGDFESAGRILSFLAGILLVPATFYLGALLFDRATGVIASVLVAVNVPLMQASVWVMTEAVYGLLFLGMVTTGWLALIRKKTAYWAVTGLMIGLAYLTKPEALAFLLLFALSILIAASADRVNARKLFLGFAVMSGVVAMIAAPYILFVHAKTGAWTISKKASTNTLSGVDEDQQLKLTNGGRQTIMDEIWGDEYLNSTENDLSISGNQGSPPTLGTKLGWAYQLFKRQVVEFVPALVSIFFFPIIAVGFFTSPWTRSDAARNLYIGAFIVATFVGYSFAVTNIRYLLAMIPLLLILTGHGAVILANWVQESVRKISAGAIELPNYLTQALAIVCLVVFSAPSIIAKFTEPGGTGSPIEEQRAGLWLRSQVSDQSITVMASSATVAYYAGAHHIFLPNEELGTLIDYAKSRNANFIVSSSRRFTRHNGGFPEIPAELEKDIQLVYSDTPDGDEYSVRIYKLRN